MAVALVLGFLTQFIAMLIISYALMKTMQSSLTKYSVLYQEEFDKEQERLINEQA